MKDFAKSIVCNTKAGNYKPDYKDVTDQELKNWIRMNEQDIREYTREAKKYEKFGSRPEFKGSYDAFQYGHAIGEIEDRKEKIKWMQDELARRKRTGNSRVGNADIYSGNYIIMGDDGDVWFRDEHEDVSIKSIDSWAQKRIASYQSSIDEIKKGVAEAKQAAKKAGMI